jgi:pilus assembly protein Flp/PilA
MAANEQENDMKQIISRLVTEEEGATIIEYVLLAALIAVVAVGAITALGNKVSTQYTNVAGKVPSAQ